MLAEADEEECALERQVVLERLTYFEPELTLLGLSLDDAPDLDEKSLRKAFYARSRALHPDAAVGAAPAAEPEGDITEVNKAYETLRKLVVC